MHLWWCRATGAVRQGTGGWSRLCQHQTPTSFRAIEEDALATVDVVEQRWKEEERAMCDELARLSDDDLTDYVGYTTPEGEKRERLLWHCLVHVVKDETQHHSQAAAILRGYGHSPGGLDFTLVLNEQRY